MSQTKIIVIVPAYKTEIYLRRCLDSIHNQTMTEILIMVVNDGSPDQSQSIIDEYVQKYPQQIIGYQKQNEGPGMARNYAIDKAIEMFGPEGIHDLFLCFVDSDDWLEKQALDVLYQEAVKTGADLVHADIRYVDGDNITYIKGFWGTNCDDPAQRVLNTNVFTVWNKLYRFSLFTTMRYPAILHEDVVTTPLIFRRAKKVAYISSPLYNYFIRNDSITGSGMIRLKPDALKAVSQLLDYATAQNDEIILQFAMEHYVEILVEYKNKPLNNFFDYELLNNGLCKRLPEKAIRAFQNAAIRRIQLREGTAPNVTKSLKGW